MVARLVIRDVQSSLVFEEADQSFSRSYDKDCQLQYQKEFFIISNPLGPFSISEQELISA